MKTAQINIKIDTKNAQDSSKRLAGSIGEVGDRTHSLKTELRLMKEALLELDEGSDQFKELSLNAADLEDKIGDVNSRVKILSSDTLRLDQTIGVIQGMAGAFQAVQGAAALFGFENENILKTLRNLQATQAMVNGVNQVAVMLNKDSAAGILLRDLRTKILNTSLITQTGATVGATGATRALNLAMMALPIVAIIAGITALVGAIIWFSSSTDDAKQAKEEFTEALRAQNKVMEANRIATQNLGKIRIQGNQTERQNNIDALKLSELELENINKKIALGQKLTDQEKERLSNLPSVIEALNEEIKELNIDDAVVLSSSAKDKFMSDLQAVELGFVELRNSIGETGEELSGSFSRVKFDDEIAKVTLIEMEFYELTKSIEKFGIVTVEQEQKLLKLVDKSAKVGIEFSKLNKELGDDVFSTNITQLDSLVGSINTVIESGVKLDEANRALGESGGRMHDNWIEREEEKGRVLDRQAQEAKKRATEIDKTAKDAEEKRRERVRANQSFFDAIEADRINKIIDSEERELQAAATKYDTLISLAEAAGQETADITENYQKQIQEINERFDSKRKNKAKTLITETEILETELAKSIELKLADTEEKKEEIRKKYFEISKKLKIKQIQEQRDIELSNTNITEEERAKIIAASNLKIAKLMDDNYETIGEDLKKSFEDVMGEIGMALSNFANGLSSMISAFSELSNVQFENDAIAREAMYESETEKLASELGNRLIDEEEYESKMEQLENAKAKEENVQRRKQFASDKKMKIGQTIMATAQAVVQAFAQLGPIAGGIMSALIAATGGIQIATIRQQQFSAARGGVVPGHPSKNDSVDSMLAPGEMVINSESASMFPSLLSAVNQAGGGVPLAPEMPGQFPSEPAFKENRRNELPIIKTYVLSSEVKEGLDTDQRNRDAATF